MARAKEATEKCTKNDGICVLVCIKLFVFVTVHSVRTDGNPQTLYAECTMRGISLLDCICQMPTHTQNGKKKVTHQRNSFTWAAKVAVSNMCRSKLSQEGKSIVESLETCVFADVTCTQYALEESMQLFRLQYPNILHIAPA